MSITFGTHEAALEHYREFHGTDFEHCHLARKFERDSNTYAERLEAADLLHATGFLVSAQDVLDFFEKPRHYTQDVWAATFITAGADPDECDECD